MICSLVDTVGSLALSSKGLSSSGASTDIHTTFIRGAGGEGAVIRIEGRVSPLSYARRPKHLKRMGLGAEHGQDPGIYGDEALQLGKREDLGYRPAYEIYRSFS